MRDLFDDENSGRLSDAALVNKLAVEKPDKAAEAVRGEGWKWGAPGDRQGVDGASPSR